MTLFESWTVSYWVTARTGFLHCVLVVCQSMTGVQSSFDSRPQSSSKWVRLVVHKKSRGKKLVWGSSFLSSSSGNEFSLSGVARGTLTVGLEENTLAPKLFPYKRTTCPQSLGGHVVFKDMIRPKMIWPMTAINVHACLTLHIMG